MIESGPSAVSPAGTTTLVLILVALTALIAALAYWNR